MKELVIHPRLILHAILHTTPTEILEQDAKQFNQLGGDLKKKMWWKNVKVCSTLLTINASMSAHIICNP